MYVAIDKWKFYISFQFSWFYYNVLLFITMHKQVL